MVLLANVIGFFVAFGIGTNEPFNKKSPLYSETKSTTENIRKAA
jgi:hypothetical protein